MSDTTADNDVLEDDFGMYDEDVDNTPEYTTTEETEKQSTPPVEQTSSVDTTKAFATRLKEEKEKMRVEERQSIAESFGYANWDEFVSKQTDSKIIDKGYDPDELKPVLKELLQNDPEYRDAMQYKKEKEELEKQIWANNCLKDLNSKFGTVYNNINELDKDTIDLWNKGIPLDKAYAANNYNNILAKSSKGVRQSGKEHLAPVAGNPVATDTKTPSASEMRFFKMLNPYASEEEFNISNQERAKIRQQINELEDKLG